MKKINALLLCTLLYHSINANEQNIPKIFQDVRNGDKKAIQEQLDNSEDLSVRDDKGNTIFHIAAQEGEEEIIHMIVENIEYNDNPDFFSWNYWGYKPKLPSLDDVNNDGDTPLHSVIVHDNNTTKNENRAKTAKYLINKKPEFLEKRNKKDFSPIFVATDTDNPQFIHLFTAYNIDLTKHRYSNVNHNFNGETILTYATKTNKQNIIKYCTHYTSLEAVANKDNKTPIELVIDADNISLLSWFEKNINTYLANNTIKPIHYAAANGKYNAFNYLLNKKISVDEPDKDGNPPLFYTIDSNNEPMFTHVLSCGANLHICNKQGENAYAIAAYQKHFNLVDLLKKKYNIDIDARDKNGRTALMRSTIEQNHDMMEKHIELGANIRITDNTRENILHKIARSGDLKGAQIALKYDKGLLSDTNVERNTPLLTAIQNGQFKLAQILMDAGSPLDTINAQGDTIFHEVAKKSNNALLTELSKINPKFINQKNNAGETAIFFTTKNNNVSAMQQLIQRGADYKNIVNIHGLTPMHYAATTDSIDAIKELEKYGISLADCTQSGNTTAHVAANYGSIKIIKYILQTQPGLLELCNKENDNVFSSAARCNQLEITKLLLREEYYLNGTINRIINSFTNNPATRNFLIKERDNRSKQCEDGYKIYKEAKDFININTKTAKNNNFHYVPSHLDRELLISSANDLWNMLEPQRSQLINQYTQTYNGEFNQKVNFEQELARIERKKQEARERIEQEKQEALSLKLAAEWAKRAEQERILQAQLAAERAEQERILQAQLAAERAEQERILQAQLAAERARQEQILQQQQAELAYKQAELERIKKERKAQLQAMQQQQHPAPAPAPSAAPAPEQPTPPAAPTNNQKIAKMKIIANDIRSQKATQENIDFFVEESKKIIAINLQTQKISKDEANELKRIADRIKNQGATQAQINNFIEKIKKAMEDEE